MKAIIDTNVIMDFYEERPDFIAAAEQTLLLCARKQCVGMVCASSATDIYYLLRKKVGKEKALACIKDLLDILVVADVGKVELQKAVASGMSDFEDAVVAFTGLRAKADYIVTRNLPDYGGSPVPAILPQDFNHLDFPE